MLAASVVPIAGAQTAVDGAIGGNVLDTTGAAVSGAQVSIRSLGTNATQNVTADDSGFYRVSHLQPGHYAVSMSAPGFSAFSSNDVLVEVGHLTSVTGTMNIGGASEEVKVSSATPAINLVSPDFSNVINQVDLKGLPVNNYRWSSYALQTPGVVQSGGFGLLSFRGQSTLLNNVTFDGADDNQAFFSEERGRTNVGYSTPKYAVQEFEVDDSNYTTEYGRSAGGVVNAVSRSGSNRFHGDGYFLNRDSYLAAFNDFTDRQVLQPNGRFASVPFKPADLRKQEGFDVGGPILHDKLFFFFALDRYYRYFPLANVASNPGVFFATPAAALPSGRVCPVAGRPSSAAISATNDSNFVADNGACTLQANLSLPTYGQASTQYTQGLNALTGILGQSPRFADQTLFFPKLDWQISPKIHASGEVNRLRFISPGGQQTNATASYGLQSAGNVYARDTWGIAKLDTLFTSNISNETRYQYGRDFNFAFNETPTSYENNLLLNTPTGYVNGFGIPPNVNITNGFQFGTATFLNRPAYPDERLWQLSDTVIWTHGNHTFKFGEDYIHTYDLAENLQNVFGAFSYGNQGTTSGLSSYLSDFYLSQNAATAGQAKHYTGYQQGFGPLGFQFTTGDYAGFVQDEWHATKRLNLTFGLRYEYEQTPAAQLPNPNVPLTASLPSDKNNIAPRVGFAFDPYGNGKLVVRGGYGIFNARLINSTIYNAIAQTGAAGGQSQIPSIVPTQAGAPAFPQILNSPTSAAATPSIIFFDPHFQLPQIHQADLAVQQQLGWNTVISVSWLGSFGRELPDFVDLNLPRPGNITYQVVNNGIAGAPLRDGATYSLPFYGNPSRSPVPGAPPAPTVINNGRPDSRYSTETNIFSGINSNYQAVVFQISHAFSHSVQFQSSYTWSHALDYGENNTTFSNANSLYDPANLGADYGNSQQNIPNRFIFTAVGDSPWHVRGWKGQLANDYELAPSFAAQNGDPYTAALSGAASNLVSSTSPTGFVTGVNTGTNPLGAGGENRIPGVQRDSFRQAAIYTLDLRLSKSFNLHEGYQLQFFAESFNLPNHQNVTAVTSTAYSLGTSTDSAGRTFNALTANPAVFGTVTNSNNNTIYSPRQIQLSAQFHF